MKDAFIFVYGTLRRSSGGAMSRWLQRRAEFVDQAAYRGRLYRVDYYPGVVPSTDPSDRVAGEVRRLHDPGPTLARLDRYEACGPGFEEPTEYIRRLQPVELRSGQPLTAWIYLYNLPLDGLPRILSGDFPGDPSA